MILYAELNTSGAITVLQSAPFTGGTDVDTTTSAAYATWYESLPANVTDTWPTPATT